MAIETPSAEHRPSTPAYLRGALTDIDAMVGSYGDQIASIVSITLARLETPEGYKHLADLANVLISVRHLAYAMQEYTHKEADSFGCGAIDEAAARRDAALMEHWRELAIGQTHSP
ncbi:hypothetical protein HFU84_12150 [Acidithiobacillus sp. CV18-2]|nr:hypothetical protein [Acidithiobacillus sp. CV18-3]MBU2756027.1 hypothetical protein [Acidithiobacillus sp. BN09-2]MBU2778238.1 hypothetical protein [Acidithiobacillus sp. CV18-2]MBU2799111.1 hypothetical protein [Acidithiobacillus sp. VAN18-4]